MNNFSLIFQHGLTYGLVLSLGMSVIIFGSIYYNAEMWWNDYPPDIKKQFGPMSQTAKQQSRIVFIPFLFMLIGFIIVSIVQLGQVVELTFSAVFLSTFFTLFTFNLIDLLVLDWLIAVTLQPQFMILPGTEGLAGYKDYWFHFHGFLKGTVFCAITSLIAAGITAISF